jgi:hypothetical protein
MAEMMKRAAESEIADGLTAREFISICALATVLSSSVKETGDIGMPQQREAAAVLLHLVVLRHYGLPQRSFAKQESGAVTTTNTPFLADFFDAARDGLAAWFKGSLVDMKWDAFDLFDGRLYIDVSTALFGTPLPQELSQGFSQMVKLLKDLVLDSVDIDALLSSSRSTITQTSESRNTPSELTSTVLPFSHPVMDQHLADVQLQSTGVAPESAISEKIFEELANWRNAKPLIDPKQIAKPKGFFAKKKHQQFMSDTIAYSASLTGASGKNIDPETIIAQDGTANTKASATVSHNTKRTEKAPKTKEGPKTNKQKAHEKAESLMLEKQAVVSRSVAASWKERCLEFAKEPSLVKRYLKAEKYFLTLSSLHRQMIGAEVFLYLGDVLLQMQSDPQTPKSAGKQKAGPLLFPSCDDNMCILDKQFPLSSPWSGRNALMPANYP